MNALSFVSMGVEARCRPCHSAALFSAHEEATLPSSLSPSPWPSPLRLPLPSPSSLPTPWPTLLPSPIVVAVGHSRCNRRQPLPLPSLLHCHQPSPLPSPLPLAIAVSITIGHLSCHLSRPSPLPLLSTMFKSCCLGAARIVFDQLKQRMRTLFYFVWTVGGALIKAG